MVPLVVTFMRVIRLTAAQGGSGWLAVPMDVHDTGSGRLDGDQGGHPVGRLGGHFHGVLVGEATPAVNVDIVTAGHIHGPWAWRWCPWW